MEANGGKVLLVRGAPASHDHSDAGRGPVLALDGMEWVEVAPAPPFKNAMFFGFESIASLDDGTFAVTGTECEDPTMGDEFEKCRTETPVVSVFDPKKSEWTNRTEIAFASNENNPRVLVRGTQGSEILVLVTVRSGSPDRFIWLNPRTGAVRNANGFDLQQNMAICTAGEGKIVQVVDTTLSKLEDQSTVDPENPSSNPEGAPLGPQPSTKQVRVSVNGKDAQVVADLSDDTTVALGGVGGNLVCGGGNLAFLTKQASGESAGAVVQVRDVGSWKVLKEFEVSPQSGVTPDPPLISDPLTDDSRVLSPDLTMVIADISGNQGCSPVVIADHVYCVEEGVLKNVG